MNRIRALYEYNRWANGRVLDAASTLNPRDFTKNLGSSYGSVRDTLVHVLSAEWIWLKRWKGISPEAMLVPSDFPTTSSLRTRWADVEREQVEFVSELTQEATEMVVAYVNTEGESWNYPLWQLLQHVVNHSTYHRGQITTMLRQLGAHPVATDFLVFQDVKSGQAG
ncbi:MAG: DinB family protein [Bacteroidota bacterium]